MLNLKSISRLLFNKYVLSTAGFICWMLFFDKNDFYNRQERTAELDALNAKIEFYQAEIAKTKTELASLQNDPATLEQYAREQYFMKRSNEDIFLFDSSGGPALVQPKANN